MGTGSGSAGASPVQTNGCVEWESSREWGSDGAFEGSGIPGWCSPAVSPRLLLHTERGLGTAPCPNSLAGLVKSPHFPLSFLAGWCSGVMQIH